jgi:hypothetical protein
MTLSGDDVKEILVNPIYAGLPPLYPPLVPEEQWIKVSARLIRELGPEAYLRAMLAALRESVQVATAEREGGPPPAP